MLYIYISYFEGHGFCLTFKKPDNNYKKLDIQEASGLLSINIYTYLKANKRWFRVYKILNKNYFR